MAKQKAAPAGDGIEKLETGNDEPIVAQVDARQANPGPAKPTIRDDTLGPDGRRLPNPYSPTGRNKGVVTVADYNVVVRKMVKGPDGKPQQDVKTFRIQEVPSPADAVRECRVMLKMESSTKGARLRAFEIAGTRRDAGEAGYSAASRPKAVELVPNLT